MLIVFRIMMFVLLFRVLNILILYRYFYLQCELKRALACKETTILGGMQIYLILFYIRPLAYPSGLRPHGLLV